MRKVSYLDKAKPFEIKTKTSEVVSYLKNNPNITMIPIINALGEPLGVLQEHELKHFLYSPFGISLLHNEFSQKTKLKNLLTLCGTADLSSDIATIIELFSNNPESVGILITKNSKYLGFLSARAIITIMHEQNIVYARDQNPLTKLPGNSAIERYIADLSDACYMLCYFDLDNFKAYNDNYGFRNGDRVIMLFADMMRENLGADFFRAHIGGDDFFAGVEVSRKEQMQYLNTIKALIAKFAEDVKAFYSKEDIQRGYIKAKDREGNMKKFDLLSVSASVVIVKQKAKKDSETINAILSLQKKCAKKESEKICISSLI